ncbi:hypothetical protein HDU67_003152 [Dinochytrium kinnereticum]|nr:hypothetical protein HDU67_003152 [Dinochytrium kinnereticum]
MAELVDGAKIVTVEIVTGMTADGTETGETEIGIGIDAIETVMMEMGMGSAVGVGVQEEGNLGAEDGSEGGGDGEVQEEFGCDHPPMKGKAAMVSVVRILVM